MKNKKSLILSVCVSLLIVLALFVLPSADQAVSAQEADNSLHGYVWSMDVGWISLNNANDAGTGTTANYKVEMTDGILTGFGWSPSLGWLRFGSDLSGPVGAEDDYSARIVEEGGKKMIRGWARFCSVYESNCSGTVKNVDGAELGGWDGWLKMVNVEYIPGDSGGTFRGYAWGDLNVGWTSFSYPIIDLPPGENDEVCNNEDDDGDGLIDEGLVCGGPPGGGFSVNCTVDPTNPIIGQDVAWTVTALSDGPIASVRWTEEIPGSLEGVQPSNPNEGDGFNPITTNYSNAGTYRLKVTATNGSGATAENVCNSGLGVTVEGCTPDGELVPALPEVCCNPDDDGDGLCGEPLPDCSLSIVSGQSRIIYHTDYPTNPLIRKAEINIIGCSPSDVAISADISSFPSDLFTLVCSDSKGGPYSVSSCSNSSASRLWVGVSPNAGVTLPGDAKKWTFNLLNDSSIIGGVTLFYEITGTP